MPSGIYKRVKPSLLMGKHLSPKSEFKKGSVPWNKGFSWFGKKYGFKKGHGFIGGGTSKGVRVSIKSEFKKGSVPWNKGLHGITVAWNKGMRTTIPIREMDHPRYASWREKVFKRDNHTCVKCKERGGKLEADHIKPWCEFPKLRYRISNGQTLCKPCHKEKTKTDLSKYWKNQYTMSVARN
jgi:hypothetical protein